MARKHFVAKTPFSTTERFIKVATAYYPQLTHTGTTSDRPVPWIQMRGLWLGRLGFGPRDKLRIEAEPGRLVISRL